MVLNTSIIFYIYVHLGPIIAGVILLGFGVALFIWTSNQMAEGQTSLGQIGRTLSSSMQAQYQQYQYMQLGGVSFVVVGIEALIYGAAKTKK